MTRTRRPPLKALAAFEAAARHGSFARAAEELNVSPTSITYQVKLVEQHYGIEIFQRTGNSVMLTPAGLVLRQKVSLALAYIDDVSHDLDSGQVRETLTVSVPVSFALKWLLFRLGGFRARHPDLDLRLRTADRERAALLAPADVEIGFGLSSSSEVSLEPLIEEDFRPYVPTAMDTAAGGDHQALIQRLPIVHYNRALVSWQLWFDTTGLRRKPMREDLVFDHAFLAVTAAAGGLGMVLEGDCLIDTELREGRLRPLDIAGIVAIRRCRYFIRYPKPGQQSEKFKLFRDWLDGDLAAWSAARLGKHKAPSH